MQPICIYHSRDLDGFTSAAIVKRKYPTAILIGFDYGQQLPMDKIPAGAPVIMVDVSIPMPEMEALAKHSSQLTWIDHHVSAINEFEAYAAEKESFMVVSLKDGISACELAWKFFNPGSQMPTAIQLLGEYDTWRNSDKQRWENEILPFQFGMRLKCNSPETFPHDMFYHFGTSTANNPVGSVIQSGKVILSFLAQNNDLLCRRAAFEADFMGYKAICMNAGGVNSDAFKSVYDPKKHDIMMPFFYTGKYWQFSIYTDREDIDCSAIAKQNGGGGHKKAAGFQVDDINSFIFSPGIPDRSQYDKCTSTKHNSVCLKRAADNEPIFVLRAKDPTAPNIVREWCAANNDLQPIEKVGGAMILADKMEEWRIENIPTTTK